MTDPKPPVVRRVTVVDSPAALARAIQRAKRPKPKPRPTTPRRNR